MITDAELAYLQRIVAMKGRLLTQKESRRARALRNALLAIGELPPDPRERLRKIADALQPLFPWKVKTADLTPELQGIAVEFIAYVGQNYSGPVDNYRVSWLIEVSKGQHNMMRNHDHLLVGALNQMLELTGTYLGRPSITASLPAP